MATFTARESQIIVLAQAIIQGLSTRQAGNFSKSPYSADEVRAELDACPGLRDNFTRLQAETAEAGAAKQTGFAAPADAVAQSETALTSQPTGKPLELRVLAVNKAGKGAVSNVVEAVV